MPHYRFKIGDIFKFLYVKGCYVIGRIYSIDDENSPSFFKYKILWRSENISKYEMAVGTFSSFSIGSLMYKHSIIMDEKTAILEVL